MIRKTHKFIISLLVLGVAAGTGFALTSPSPKASDGKQASIDRQAVEQIVHDYLMENPDVIINALEAYQEKKYETEQKNFQEKLSQKRDFFRNNEDLPYAGNPDGDVMVVEFFDYNCGYCKKAFSDVQKILEEDDNVKVVFVEMPILSASSSQAAVYATAAFNQGSEKYFDYHAALMNSTMPKTPGNLEKIAEKVGLDVEKLREDVKDPKIADAIKENLTLAGQLGIRGTPAFIIGDMFSPGYIGYDAMKKAIADARAN